MHVEDRVLVWRLNRGDATALSRVYEKYRDDLLRLALSLLNNGATAEDIVQDVFVRFAGAARVFRLTGSLKSYLATCVANTARNALKADRRRQTREHQSGSPNATSRVWEPYPDWPSEESRSGDRRSQELAADGDGPEHELICSEQLGLVCRALEVLPAEQREVVSLRLYGDMPFREIAGWQKTSIKTVQSRYHYGLTRLRSLQNGEVSP